MTAITLLTGRACITPHAARIHAIKNCLGVVATAHALLEPELFGDALARLHRAKGALARMIALLEEDLALESPREEPRPCACEDIIGAVVDQVEDRAEAAGVKLDVRCGPGSVCGLRTELVEALANVVLNAIEVTPRGASVLMSSFEVADGTQFWTVRDSGPGVPDEILTTIGTPWHSRKRGGWGLGLAITRTIVERHHGLVHFDSRRGLGTLVTLCFPSRRA
jgi:signal transduction histidine kinase